MGCLRIACNSRRRLALERRDFFVNWAEFPSLEVLDGHGAPDAGGHSGQNEMMLVSTTVKTRRIPRTEVRLAKRT